MSRGRALTPFGVIAVAVVAVHLFLRLTGTEYCLTQLTMSVYYALVVLGLSLLIGYAGQVSLGHGAFFALGGYTSAVLTTHNLGNITQIRWAQWLRDAHVLVEKQDLFGNQIVVVTPWAAFLAAMVVTLVAAYLIGYPSLRLRGHYLAMATLGFGLIIGKLLVGNSVTGGADGINGVPPWTIVPGLTVSGRSALRVENYYIACGLMLVILGVLRNIVQSGAGRALLAIHDAERAANAMGIDTAAYKLRVFLLSALLAAVAGVFYTHYAAGIGPSESGALKSVRYVALAAAGGMSNLWGVAAVSIVLNYASLRGWFGTYDNAVFGLILIAIISLTPDGPLKPLGAWIRTKLRKTAGTEVPRGAA